MIVWLVAGAATSLAALGLFSHLRAKSFERDFPPRGDFVATPFGALHLTRRDPPGAPGATIALIHGASGNQADLMAPLGDRLAARGFRVVAVDRPGHGYSERLHEDASSPAAQARAIRAALQAASVERAIVVGHSWAGAVAVAFALDHADFTQGIVLLAPVTHPWPRGVRWYYRLASKPVLGWLFARTLLLPAGLASLKGALAGVFAPQPVPPGYAEAIGAVLALRPWVFRANAEDVADLRGHLEKQAPRIPTIALPVAILSGDRDGVVLTERHSYGCAREIAGATLDMLPGVGHSPHWAAPERTVETIAALVARSQSVRQIDPEAPSSAPSTSS
ncbi:MAG: alpha/beta hydrolase [Methylobacteriaceae bacterium]|nr:alpha/beta hydrolase [Methylobacteriaceae bacterium]